MAQSARSKRPRYVLIIEDNVHHAEILTEVLDKQFAPVVIHTVDTIEDGLDFAAQSTYDLILTGAIIREEQIANVIPRLTKLAEGTPVIVISGRGDEMLAAEIIKRGATEYLVKTRETLEILPSIMKKHMKAKRSGKRKNVGRKSKQAQHLPSPTAIIREVDKLTQQALAIVGPKHRRGRRPLRHNEELDQLLSQIQRLRQMASKLLTKE